MPLVPPGTTQTFQAELDLLRSVVQPGTDLVHFSFVEGLSLYQQVMPDGASPGIELQGTRSTAGHLEEDAP